ncbi:hypothetical protein IT893_02570 [Thalassospira sp. A40-3]|uniref:hypothetical protein n=1 Tax=Thalassospira sp. A40-3 TaxID=2785908 RepID=UPI0018CE40EC|nr:hypothetical protein [Thalassospira sp. A40-3]QPO12424.1 hypothetical protein IT893_02570 [Thalassospira sp. A40-3]
MRRIALHAVPCQTTRQKQTKRSKFNATGSTAFHRLFDGVWCSETAFGTGKRYPKPLSVVKQLILNDLFCNAAAGSGYPQGWGEIACNSCTPSLLRKFINQRYRIRRVPYFAAQTFVSPRVGAVFWPCWAVTRAAALSKMVRDAVIGNLVGDGPVTERTLFLSAKY